MENGLAVGKSTVHVVVEMVVVDDSTIPRLQSIFVAKTGMSSVYLCGRIQMANFVSGTAPTWKTRKRVCWRNLAAVRPMARIQRRQLHLRQIRAVRIVGAVIAV